MLTEPAWLWVLRPICGWGKGTGEMSNEQRSIPGNKIQVNGVGYHVGEQGSGDKVALLLHGMPDTSSLWRYQVPALVEGGYRVIVPDMLGYGATDKPQDPQRYRGELILGDMIGLLDALGVSKVDLLMGHDWGPSSVGRWH